MFVRVLTTKGRRYLQVVESYRKGGMPRHRVLISLGRCDDRAREQRVRDLIRDYQPLVHAQLLLTEMEREEVQGRQGRGYFKKLHSWR